MLALVDGFNLTGCLLPQDISGVPGETNLPPVFPLLGATPLDPVTCVSRASGSTPPEFQVVGVQDPNGDEDQLLTARWFLDYDPQDETSTTPIKTDLLAPDSPPADGDYGWTYTVPQYNSLLLPITLSLGTHVLEVVISDGFDVATSAPANRKAKDGRYTVTKGWTIKYVDTAPCEGGS